MKAEELRIGNYIYDDFNEVHKVESIQSDAMIHYDGTHESNVKFSKIDDPHSIYECDTVTPIPLTEEWLLKLGFKLRLNQEWMLCKGVLCLNIGNNNIWEYGNKVITTPKHVHQLQNLYYALTGEELKII